MPPNSSGVRLTQPAVITDTDGLRERGKNARISRIVEAACAILRADGPQGLTVARIAEDAEVSQGTVFNLIGTRDQIWAAIAEHSFSRIELVGFRSLEDPQIRARAIIDAVVAMICSDAKVFRPLLLNWELSSHVSNAEPTPELLRCLEDAQTAGVIQDQLRLRRLAQQITTGFIGTMHQWAAHVISDATFRLRTRDFVDLVFMAARRDDRPGQVSWHFDTAKRQ
jgi:AcrR family transcriptional regulator